MIRLTIGTMAMAALMGWPVAAQSPIAVTSQVESGWTSNATDSASGGADTFVTHNEEILLTGTAGSVLLRGTLRLQQTRFAVTRFENDDELAGGIEAELALGANAKLRLGYAVTRSWTGDDLRIGDFTLPVRSTETDHELVGNLVIIGPDQQVSIGVTTLWAMQGDSELVGLGLKPVKLEPDVGSVTTNIAWEKALSPTVAALAAMEAWFTSVPVLDQYRFFRAPADRARASAGMRVVAGALTLTGSAGLNLVWPRGRADLRRTSPYYALSASLAPAAGLRLTLDTASGIELVDPLDGVAGRTIAVDLGATLALAPQLELSALLGGWQEGGLYDTSLIRSRRTASLGLHYAVSPRLGYGATVSLAHHDNPGESYDKSGVALSVSGSL